MATNLVADPTASMSPGQRQELANASQPIGTATDAAASLHQLEQARERITARLRHATRAYRDMTTLPEGVDDATREAVHGQAEREISGVETASRRDLAVLTARAQAIQAQLADAASEPNLSAVPDDVLDAANRFLPLVQSQLAGQPLPALQKRLTSAIIRDDQSECLALAMILNPILADRIDNPQEDGDERYLAYELRDSLRSVTDRWRNTSLDSTLDHAERVAKKLADLDHAVLAGYADRTGDSDPFGFLAGLDR